MAQCGPPTTMEPGHAPRSAKAGEGPRLSVFLHDLTPGGTERMMVNLINEFAECGQAVDLVLLNAVGSFLSQVHPDVRIVNLDKKRALRGIPALARYLRQERPAALLSALTHINLAAILAGLLARQPTRVVISERSTISREIAETKSRAMTVAPLLIPCLYRRADRIIAVSRSGADDLAKTAHIARERITVINNPVVTRRIRQLATCELSHAWFETGEPPVILGVGRLSAEKDFATLIRAFAIARTRTPARLVILGEGPERTTLQGLIRDLNLNDSVDLPGFTDNPYRYMARAAALVLSSRWEGSPNVLVEAMSLGIPVAATDCPSGPSEILEGGRLGPLVPVGDTAQLADAIAGLLAEPRDTQALRERAAEYGAERARDRYLEVLLG